MTMMKWRVCDFLCVFFFLSCVFSIRRVCDRQSLCDSFIYTFSLPAVYIMCFSLLLRRTTSLGFFFLLRFSLFSILFLLLHFSFFAFAHMLDTRLETKKKNWKKLTASYIYYGIQILMYMALKFYFFHVESKPKMTELWKFLNNDWKWNIGSHSFTHKLWPSILNLPCSYHSVLRFFQKQIVAQLRQAPRWRRRKKLFKIISA